MNLAVELSRSSPVPLYHQLVVQLRRAITSGEIPTGSFLDNELELADAWQVSRPTARRAIAQLVADGLLVRRRGVGTQVVSAEVRRPFTLSSLHDDLDADGRAPATDVVEIVRSRPPNDVALELEIATTAPVLYIERVRHADGHPLAVIRNWLPDHVAEHIDPNSLAETGLYTLLRHAGITPHRAHQRLGARAASDHEAHWLGIEAGAPLVTMHRVTHDDTGRIIEVADTSYNAQLYSVEMSVAVETSNVTQA